MGGLKILAGSANPPLAADLAAALGVRLCEVARDRFPDGERHVELLESVRGDDVYLVQPTCPPVDENLVELLLLADACRRAGARRVTAVIPYYGYARQDRRAGRRAPVAARAVADLLKAVGVGRIVTVDAHTQSLEGLFVEPVEHLTAVPLLCGSAALRGHGGVVVSPDLGGVKLADRYSRLLDLPMAVVHKHRISGEEVRVRTVVGEVAGRAPIVVDDMISTAGTMVAAVQALLDAGCRPEITLVATHALLVGPAVERLAALPLQRLVVTDSIPCAALAGVPHSVEKLGPLLAEAVRLLHEERSLSGLAGQL